MAPLAWPPTNPAPSPGRTSAAFSPAPSRPFFLWRPQREAVVAHPQACPQGRVNLRRKPAHGAVGEEEVDRVRVITVERLIDIIARPGRVPPGRPHDIVEPDVGAAPRHV